MTGRKLIAIDLDGTLLKDEGRVSAATAAVIAEVQKEGHKVVIATGRHTASALPIAEELGLTDAIITFNGALIMDRGKNQVKIAYAYQEDQVKNITDLVKELGLAYIISTQKDHYIEPQFSSLIKQYSAYGAQVKELVCSKGIGLPILKTAIIGPESHLNQLEPQIQQKLPYLSVVRSGEESLDIMNRKASKGAALKWLANYYKVKREDIISFGNYYNDISMLEYAGIGVAVANAPDYVRRKSDLVTDSNEKDGVARFLESYLLASVYSQS